jgi:putative CocE/NonD family hydrolase
VARDPTDRHWGFQRAGTPPSNRGSRGVLRSLRLTMRDGARIAIDLHLPRGAGAPSRVLTIVRQTRYLRSLEARGLFGPLGVTKLFDIYAGTRAAFLAHGYAWVDVDVRGTGASTGAWRSPWFEDEVRDGGEIVDWIVRQPWSSGKVGSLGISYDGTCAEMLLANRHPAVRAVAPLFSLYDVYSDVAFPGGVHLAWFTSTWSRYNAALDRNAYGEAMTEPLWLMARAANALPSPRRTQRLIAALGRVDEDRFRRVVARLLDGAVSGVHGVERRGDGLPGPADLAMRAGNLDVHAGALKITFRDDAGVHPEFPDRTIDSFSPHAFLRDIADSGAAIYSFSGWRDGAYPHAAIKRHLTVRAPGSRLTLGPWAHTGRLRIHALDTAKHTEFDHAGELLDFFDVHLKDADARGDRLPVHYFTLGEERWKSATTWPPAGLRPRSFFLAGGRRLLPDAPETAGGNDVYAVDERVGTGERSRWRSLISLVPGDYPDRRDRDERLLVYEGPVLGAELEATGHPVVTVFAAYKNTNDGALFAYLEDVAPDGRVGYVTEGQLRAVHRVLAGNGAREYVSPAPHRTFRRAVAAPLVDGELVELTFDLLPVSYMWKKGHRLRLAFACADADHFAPTGAEGATMIVHRGGALPSRLVLTVA